MVQSTNEHSMCSRKHANWWDCRMWLFHECGFCSSADIKGDGLDQNVLHIQPMEEGNMSWVLDSCAKCEVGSVHKFQPHAQSRPYAQDHWVQSLQPHPVVRSRQGNWSQSALTINDSSIKPHRCLCVIQKACSNTASPWGGALNLFTAYSINSFDTSDWREPPTERRLVLQSSSYAERHTAITVRPTLPHWRKNFLQTCWWPPPLRASLLRQTFAIGPTITACVWQKALPDKTFHVHAIGHDSRQPHLNALQSPDVVILNLSEAAVSSKWQALKSRQLMQHEIRGTSMQTPTLLEASSVTRRGFAGGTMSGRFRKAWAVHRQGARFDDERKQCFQRLETRHMSFLSAFSISWPRCRHEEGERGRSSAWRPKSGGDVDRPTWRSLASLNKSLSCTIVVLMMMMTQ